MSQSSSQPSSQPPSQPPLQPSSLVALPRQARPPPVEDGPYIAVHEGIATGVYPQREKAWQNLVHVCVPKDDMDAKWRTITTWNEACWYVITGTVLAPGTLTGEVRSRPRRLIQPPEILSLVFPEGFTIVAEHTDYLMTYTSNKLRPVSESRRSSYSLPVPVLCRRGSKSTQPQANDLGGAFSPRESSPVDLHATTLADGHIAVTKQESKNQPPYEQHARADSRFFRFATLDTRQHGWRRSYLTNPISEVNVRRIVESAF
ncbi:hypothetical protein FRC08_001758 [Ceratobasidium sp. 394]|nr:hypothetical protein FRC08_001758 [Ceratobasidium sp. 394]